MSRSGGGASSKLVSSGQCPFHSSCALQRRTRRSAGTYGKLQGRRTTFQLTWTSSEHETSHSSLKPLRLHKFAFEMQVSTTNSTGFYFWASLLEQDIRSKIWQQQASMWEESIGMWCSSLGHLFLNSEAEAWRRRQEFQSWGKTSCYLSVPSYSRKWSFQGYREGC